MNLRDMIRSVLREELSPETKPIELEPSAGSAVSDRAASLAQVKALREKIVSLEASKSDVRDDERRIAELEVELNEIRRRVALHYSKIRAEYFSVDCELQRELGKLRSMCSAQIIKFEEWALEEHARLRSLKPKESRRYGQKNLLVDNAHTPVELFSNQPAISRRMKALIAARNRAEELKFANLSEGELRLELDSLQAALPDIDTVELVGVY